MFPFAPQTALTLVWILQTKNNKSPDYNDHLVWHMWRWIIGELIIVKLQNLNSPKTCHIFDGQHNSVTWSCRILPSWARCSSTAFTPPLRFTYNGKLIPWKWPSPSQRGVKKSVKWEAGQYISYLIRHPRRERETEREMGSAFFLLMS